MERTYSRAEVVELLSALERQCSEAALLAKAAETEASKLSFGAYRGFRDKVGEFDALVVLVRQRLRRLDDPRQDDLRERVERLGRVMLALLVRASMRFFFVLSANSAMPLGAREMFVSELRSLHAAREQLIRPENAGKLGADLERDLETASHILREILDKAPGLVDLRR